MLHQEKVFQEIAKLMKRANADQNTDGWFKYRMTAIGRVLGAMTEEELRDVDAKKAEMSKQGFPADERPR